MTKSALQDLAEAAELHVRSYSGRFMFGKDCLGIEGSSITEIYGALFQAAADVSCDMQTIAEELQGAHSDSMGRDVIVYFPQVAYESDEDEEDEEDEEDYSLEEACQRGVFD